MARKKYTTHGKKRYSHRYEGGDRIDVLVNRAIHYGLVLTDFKEDTALYNYVLNKMVYKNKKVRLLDGYVFIFFRTSNRLITMYPVPDELIDEYHSYAFIEKRKRYGYKINRTKWRKP